MNLKEIEERHALLEASRTSRSATHWVPPNILHQDRAFLLAEVRRQAARIEAYEAFVAKVRLCEVEFVLFQDDECVATGSGPQAAMLAEAAHYQMMYGQDGSTQTEFYVRVPLAALAELDKP